MIHSNSYVCINDCLFVCLFTYAWLFGCWPSTIGTHTRTVCFAGHNEKRLLHDLLDQYNTLERPVVNESDPLQISFGLTLMQIIDVDEKNQMLVTNIWLKLVSILHEERVCSVSNLLQSPNTNLPFVMLWFSLQLIKSSFLFYFASPPIPGMEWYEFKVIFQMILVILVIFLYNFKS